LRYAPLPYFLREVFSGRYSDIRVGIRFSYHLIAKHFDNIFR
jgi:hypothetical protein